MATRYLLKTIGIVAFGFIFISGCATTRVEKTAYTEDEVLQPDLPVSAPGEYVARYEDFRIQVDENLHGADAARMEALRILIARLKQMAFEEAADDIINTSAYRIPGSDLKKMAHKASKAYPEFIKVWGIEKQEAVKPANSKSPEEMVVTVYFKIDRKALKDALLASVETKELTFEKKEIMAFTIPTSTPTVYVAIFSDYRMNVPEDIKDRDEARRKTIQQAISNLKYEAFQEAAEDINHVMAQPMAEDEFKRAVAKASKNYPNFVMDWEITKQVVETRGPLALQPETVKVSAYFRIDKRLLKKALITDRAITPVGKYRTYVELFWNAPGKDIHPEVVDTTLASTEDFFTQAGYEVIQFEQVKGELIQLMRKDGRKTNEIYSEDDARRFQANLELRNIDKKFVNGKRILSEYADLLIGVTIKSLERGAGMVRIRIAADGTLFERGNWITLAHSEKAGAIPYVRGSTDIIMALARRTATRVSAELEEKIRKKIALRKTMEDIQLGEIRDFELVFRNLNRQQFLEIKTDLMKGGTWVFKAVDIDTRTINLVYEGPIDTLAEKVGKYLEDANLGPRMTDYSKRGNKILFGPNR